MYKLLALLLLLSACANTAPIEKTDSASANKALVRGVFKAMEVGDLEYINQAFAPDGESIIGSTIRPRGGPHDTFAKAAPFPAGLDNRTIEIESLLADQQTYLCSLYKYLYD